MPLSALYTKATKEALDLLENMIKFNPDKRFSAAQCLAHPYFKKLHDVKKEITSDVIFDWENTDRINSDTKAQMRKMIYNQILDFHKSNNND